MTIRFAKPEDKKYVIQLLDELIVEVNKKSNKAPKHTEENDKREALFDHLLQRDDVKIFLAEKDGKLVGIADVFILPIMRRGYYQGHVEDFVVTESMRGKGVGTQLMFAIKEYCKNNNINIIKINSGNELEDAHRFYEKSGGEFTEKLFRFDL